MNTSTGTTPQHVHDFPIGARVELCSDHRHRPLVVVGHTDCLVAVVHPIDPDEATLPGLRVDVRLFTPAALITPGIPAGDSNGTFIVTSGPAPTVVGLGTTTPRPLLDLVADLDAASRVLGPEPGQHGHLANCLATVIDGANTRQPDQVLAGLDGLLDILEHLDDLEHDTVAELAGALRHALENVGKELPAGCQAPASTFVATAAGDMVELEAEPDRDTIQLDGVAVGDGQAQPTLSARNTLATVLRNLEVPSGSPVPTARWSLVGHLICHGSGYSQALCRALGVDPDKTVQPGKGW